MLWLTLTLKVASCLSRARVLSFAMQKPILRHQHESRRTHGYPPQPPPPPPPLPRSVSARELYPVFLTFQDTLALQVGWAWRGLVDAFRWDIVVRLITRNVRAHVLKSFMLNGISVLSIYVVGWLYPPAPPIGGKRGRHVLRGTFTCNHDTSQYPSPRPSRCPRQVGSVLSIGLP
ncbi:hypothetical protein V8E53_012857 [Lactarius tabidus]